MRHNILPSLLAFFLLVTHCTTDVYARGVGATDLISEKNGTTYANTSVLATGKWIKVSTTNRGIVKLSYNKLNSMGISNPSNVAVYSNGGFMLPKMNYLPYPDDLTQLPVIHAKDKSGANCIFFYSPGSTSWSYNSSTSTFDHTINLYSDSTFFYLSSDVTPSPAPSGLEVPAENADTTISTYSALAHYEKEKINLINSGRLWFSDLLLSGLRKTYTFSFENAIDGKLASLMVNSGARCSEVSKMNVKANSTNSYSIDYRAVNISSDGADYAYLDKSALNIPAKSNITLDFTYSAPDNGEGSKAYIDNITLAVPSRLQLSSGQTDFRNADVRNYTTVEYRIENTNNNTIVWNVTSPLEPKQVFTTFNNTNNTTSIKCSGGIVGEYLVFDPVNGNFPEPQFSANVPTQNIHGLPNYDFIIVTHPNFAEQAERLAEFRRTSDNLSVLVVTTTEVFNEFSSGLPDIAAIRNMFRMFYSRNKASATTFKYALLMGDGSYNNRSTDKEKFNNYIPTYQSVGSLTKGSSFVSDDFFGLLDEDEGENSGFIDIGLGRIPCATENQAEIVIDKIIKYSSNETLGSWRNTVCLIADDEDGNAYMKDAEEINTILHTNWPGFSSKKIYIDAYKQVATSGGFSYPDANKEINETINDGALIVNYIGHGNPNAMASENIVVTKDISSWKNSQSLSLFLTATCEFGPFDAYETSAGENVLLNPSGGAVAIFTTTRVVFGDSNQELSKLFYKNIFKHDEMGEKLRLGDVMRNAKASLAKNDENKSKFVLLADPTLRLAFPKFNVCVDKINGVEIDSNRITLGALEKVTIEGSITDHNDNLIPNFNGKVNTTIFDKEQTAQTLANDGGTPFEYPVQNNVIYKGESSVIDGKFQLTFIVPKDISYNIGPGKILFYATDNEHDANGAVTNINIGGSGNNPITENTPPEVELFMNNEDFKPYDKISSSALLWVNIFDESGINAAGAGIGHDLVAVIDGDYSNPIILNNYFSNISDSYQKGRIIYPIEGLEPGEHKIWVKIWDVQNNSAEKETYFIVDNGFKITSVCNMPNPVSSYTDFVIDHNLPGDIFNIGIDIYTLSGQKIANISEMSVPSSRTTTLKVRWNLFEEALPVNRHQWLVYQVKLKSQSGLTAHGAGKMVVVNK